jgi:phenylpropionate dioxygenase-like ring-hydroxylating dioxygenase large terminal subunit
MISIKPSAYSSESVFESEMQKIFSKRFFVGADADYLEPDHYRSLRIGRKALTIRRTTVGIRAFDNVCLHRNALIDPLGNGSRPFRCGYHGWGYDHNGALKSTPLTDERCISRRELSEYPVSRAGGLLFVGVNGIAPCVDKVEAALTKIGMSLISEPPFHRAVLAHECNWKLIVDNVIEGYHLTFVHPQTFQIAGFDSRSKYEWGYDEYTCWHHITPIEGKNRLTAMQKLATTATHDFRHAYIFPNLFVTTTNQLIGLRSYMIPISSHRTNLGWELFELPALKALATPVREHMKNEAIKFTTMSLLEDKPLIESCQLGLSSQAVGMQLQPSEDRIQRFHNFYTEQMRDV